MKAAFIPVLAAFVGFAAAEAACKVSDGDYKNVEKRENCDMAVQDIKDHPDDEFTTEGCYSLGCAGGCDISICGDKLTLKKKDIEGAVNDILNTCAPDGQAFQGEAPSGEATVSIFKPSIC